MSSILEICELTKRFGGVLAVDRVSLVVKTGEIHGLIGPNGSGKTTLFNCLTGIYLPTSGDILLNGHSVVGKGSHRIVAAGIARTFQNLRLFGGMTALENVMVGRGLHLNSGIMSILFGSSASNAERGNAFNKARQLLEFCGLSGREDILARDLPYGFQRRLEIARALASEPKLLLLDEPAAGMNPAEADSLKRLILEVNKLGVTILIIEHNVRLVMGLCQWVTVLDSGCKIADDIPERIISNPAVIEAYLGRNFASETR